MEEQYEVGQILYMTSKKSFKIIPVQVVEEVIRTTVNGVEKTYIVMFPDKGQTKVDIREIHGSTFKNVKEVKDHLFENTKKAINQLVKEADIVKNEAFGAVSNKKHESPVAENEKEIIMQGESQDVIIKVDLGGGQMGRISKSSLKNIKGESK